MKFFKELPFSIYRSLYLRLNSEKNLIKSKKTLPLVVSLTSIPERFYGLDIVLKSIFNQSVLPEKIYLWINERDKDKLPKRLQKLEGEILEIKYSHLTCPHKKLIHTLKIVSDKPIITIDDDVIYDSYLLEKLYNQHLKYPKDIIGNECTQIKLSTQNNYLPFVEWRSIDKENTNNSLLPIGLWGVLYPPFVFSEEVHNEEAFLRLAPRADDLWFKAMALINGTISRQSEDIAKEPIPIIGSQKVALHKENIKNRKNEEQWKALSDEYKLYDILSKKS